MTLWFVRSTSDVALSETGKAGAVFRASVCSSRFVLLVSRYHFSTCSISKYWGTNPTGMLFLRTLLPINWLAGIDSFFLSFFFAIGHLLRWHPCFCMFFLALGASSYNPSQATLFFFTFVCLLSWTSSTAFLNSHIVHSPEGILGALTLVAEFISFCALKC